MALRNSLTKLPKALERALNGSFGLTKTISSRFPTHGGGRYGMATVVPPVTQDSANSKGPTAMVFLNMGGPSTTDDVGDYLSRLFVCVILKVYSTLLTSTLDRQMVT
jgi:ferrochelatase